MSQISLFGASEDSTSSKPDPKPAFARKQSKTAAKRLASSAVQKVEIQPKIAPFVEPNPALYGLCRICNRPIAIPGLDASLCSNPSRTCGSGGWVVDSEWLAATPSHSSKGGAA